MRRMATKFSNTFSVGIFACCREVFSAARHCGLFSGTKPEADVHFTGIVVTKIESVIAEDSKKKEDAIMKMNEL